MISSSWPGMPAEGKILFSQVAAALVFEHESKPQPEALRPVDIPQEEALAAERRAALRSVSRWRSVGTWSRDVLVSVAAAMLIIIFCGIYLYQPVRVEGTSMLPVLEDQDRLFINKFEYRFGAIRRGEVVVFYYPHDISKSYIKRVIGLPGDRLSIEHGVVTVNGQTLKEPYVPERFADDRSLPEQVIPPNEYFVMGDHRSISSDSRDFGPVPRAMIYGKASLVYWPMDQFGVVK